LILIGFFGFSWVCVFFFVGVFMGYFVFCFCFVFFFGWFLGGWFFILCVIFLYCMLHDYSAWRVLEVFFDEPTKDHYLREISRKSDLSHTSVKNHLERLMDLGLVIVREEERGERTYPIYVADVNSVDFKELKKIDLVYRLRESGLVDELKDVFMPDCIVLFGSGVRGEDAEFSDVDIYLKAEDESVDLIGFEEKLNRSIELHVNPRFVEYPRELKNNILNGIVLDGYLEAFK